MVLSIGPLLFRVVVFFLSDKGKASSRVGFRTRSVEYGEPLFKPVLPPVYKKFCKFMYMRLRHTSTHFFYIIKKTSKLIKYGNEGLLFSGDKEYWNLCDSKNKAISGF